MCDYRQMVRFGIPRASIPEGAVVVNVPVPYYEVHRILIGTTCAMSIA